MIMMSCPNIVVKILTLYYPRNINNFSFLTNFKCFILMDICSISYEIVNIKMYYLSASRNIYSFLTMNDKRK